MRLALVQASPATGTAVGNAGSILAYQPLASAEEWGAILVSGLPLSPLQATYSRALQRIQTQGLRVLHEARPVTPILLQTLDWAGERPEIELQLIHHDTIRPIARAAGIHDLNNPTAPASPRPHLELALQDAPPGLRAFLQAYHLPFDTEVLQQAVTLAQARARTKGETAIILSSGGIHGSTTLLGHTGVILPDGRTATLGPRTPGALVMDLSSGIARIIHEDGHTEKAPTRFPSEIESLHDTLISGLRLFLQSAGLRAVTLGLSGGIDSALVLYLAVKALGAGNVLPILMPSPFTSAASVRDSIRLAKNLQTETQSIDIQPITSIFEAQLAPLLGPEPRGTTLENLQARTRGILLMATSNHLGHAVLNTSNKSEVAVGYSTMYGDMCGAISVIGDVYKHTVYQLARYINLQDEIIPEHIITRAPTAELRAGQTDQDSLPPYDTLDTILDLLIRHNHDLDWFTSQGFSRELVAHVFRLVRGSGYKRAQMPPILRVSHHGLPHTAPNEGWPQLP